MSDDGHFSSIDQRYPSHTDSSRSQPSIFQAEELVCQIGCRGRGRGNFTNPQDITFISSTGQLLATGMKCLIYLYIVQSYEQNAFNSQQQLSY